MLKKLTLPEWLALFRIITFPVMVILVFLVEREIYGWIYIILFSTDGLDGFTAFLMKNDSDRREILDTWGDNCYIFAGLVGFYHYEEAFFLSYWWVIALVIGLYVLELVMSLRRFGKPSYFHNYLTKVAIFFQIIFLVYLFFFDANLMLFLVAALFSVLDVIDELIIQRHIKEWRTHIKGFWEVI